MTKGQRIQKLRSDASLSQEAFANMIGVSRQSVSKWEADKAFPEVDKLAVIARQFGVSCDWLITGEEILEEDISDSTENTADGIGEVVSIPKKQWHTLILCAIASTLTAITLGVCLLIHMLG